VALRRRHQYVARLQRINALEFDRIGPRWLDMNGHHGQGCSPAEQLPRGPQRPHLVRQGGASVSQPVEYIGEDRAVKKVPVRSIRAQEVRHGLVLSETVFPWFIVRSEIREEADM